MRVSIITPSYRQGQFIERTLQSVVDQKGAEIEHVVLDGGSTDNTIEILKRFSGTVRWVSKKDHGQADAVNKGILATNGDIIGWLNSDDIYYPGAIARVTEHFKKYPEIDVVYGMADHIDLADQVLAAYPTEDWSLEKLKERCFICQPALFFRRRVFETNGMLDVSLKYCMDYEYWLRIGEQGVRFSYLQEKLAGSRLYPWNKTLGSKQEVHREINDMIKKKYGRVSTSRLLNYAHILVEGKLRKNEHPILFRIRFLLTSMKVIWQSNRDYL